MVNKICEHGRQKFRCKDCGGSGICEHHRQKRNCKECGGSNICEHGRQKQQCKACGGSSLCQHGRQKSKCKACGGSNICEHGRQKQQCKECGGSGICEHGRQKQQCKACGFRGSALKKLRQGAAQVMGQVERARKAGLVAAPRPPPQRLPPSLKKRGGFTPEYEEWCVGQLTTIYSAPANARKKQRTVDQLPEGIATWGWY